MAIGIAFMAAAMLISRRRHRTTSRIVSMNSRWPP
jgi:hypothetical protein